MKAKMVQTIATPSSSQSAIAATLVNHILMVLPKKTTFCRLLRRHQKRHVNAGTGNSIPATPIDLLFEFPKHFTEFLQFDSGPGDDRIIILGDNVLLDGLARAGIWLADGTFKVVPFLFFQLYSIHFLVCAGYQSCWLVLIIAK